MNRENLEKEYFNTLNILDDNIDLEKEQKYINNLSDNQLNSIISELKMLIDWE